MAEPVLDVGQPDLHRPAHWWDLARRLAVSALAFLASFFLAGFSEQAGLIQIMVLAVAAWFMPSRAAVYALLGGVVGYAVVILAPGNSIRSALLDGGLPLGVALVQSAYYPLFYALRTVREHPASLAVVVLLGWVAGHGRVVWNRRLRLLVVFLATWLVMTASLFPPLWVGGAISPRLLSLPHLALVLAFAAVGYLVSCRSR